MERITDKHLEGMLKRINEAAGFDNPKYSTPGAYCLDYAYGGVKLEQYCNESGGVREITSGFDTKRVTYNLMHAYLLGMQTKN